MTKFVNPRNLDGQEVPGGEIPKVSLRGLDITYPSQTARPSRSSET